jgi:pimeloyl-ACP methyl ester carboxylesterase
MSTESQSLTKVTYLGHEIYVSAVGTGHAVLFLHGWPTNSRLWQAQVDVLKANYRVITLNWLGFGKSDKPHNYFYTFTQMNEALDAVITSVLGEEESLTIIAHDIGGPAAVLWADKHPNRLRQLILLNTILFPFSTPLDKVSQFSFKIPLLNKLLVSNAYLKQLMKTLTQSKDKATNERIAEVLNWPEGLSGTLKLKTIRDSVEHGRHHELPTLSSKLARLGVKKHLIIARHDPLCYAHMKRMQKIYPEIPCLFVEKCGHYIPLDKPEALNRLLVQMLNHD